MLLPLKHDASPLPPRQAARFAPPLAVDAGAAVIRDCGVGAVGAVSQEIVTIEVTRTSGAVNRQKVFAVVVFIFTNHDESAQGGYNEGLGPVQTNCMAELCDGVRPEP